MVKDHTGQRSQWSKITMVKDARDSFVCVEGMQHVTGIPAPKYHTSVPVVDSRCVSCDRPVNRSVADGFIFLQQHIAAGSHYWKTLMT